MSEGRVTEVELSISRTPKRWKASWDDPQYGVYRAYAKTFPQLGLILSRKLELLHGPSPPIIFIERYNLDIPDKKKVRRSLWYFHQNMNQSVFPSSINYPPSRLDLSGKTQDEIEELAEDIASRVFASSTLRVTIERFTEYWQLNVLENELEDRDIDVSIALRAKHAAKYLNVTRRALLNAERRGRISSIGGAQVMEPSFDYHAWVERTQNLKIKRWKAKYYLKDDLDNYYHHKYLRKSSIDPR